MFFEIIIISHLTNSTYYPFNDQLPAISNAKSNTIKIALNAEEMPPHTYPIVPYTIQLNITKAIK